MDKGKFWFVWNPHGRNPSHMHATKDNAINEARRLATQNPGHDFIVLKSVAGFTVDLPPPPPVKQIDMAEYVHDNIPF